MLDSKKIAVTGGIASGKSTVCRLLRDLGAYTVSADHITHELLASDNTLKQQILSLLGNEILEGGAIDRAKVAKKVFRSPELLHKLERLIHPRVEQAIKKEWQEQKKRGGLFVVEMPLLFETQDVSWYDATIAVVADEALCRERFCKKMGLSAEEYAQRMARHLRQEEKALRATYVITNNSTPEALAAQVNNIYATLGVH